MGPEPHSPPASEHPALLLGQGGEALLSPEDKCPVPLPSLPSTATEPSPPKSLTNGTGFPVFFFKNIHKYMCLVVLFSLVAPTSIHTALGSRGTS